MGPALEGASAAALADLLVVRSGALLRAASAPRDPETVLVGRRVAGGLAAAVLEALEVDAAAAKVLPILDLFDAGGLVSSTTSP